MSENFPALGEYVLPGNVPAGCIVDFDLYDPLGMDQSYDEAWRLLREAGERAHRDGIADLVWTPRNEGHWIATRGPVICDVLSNHEHFSSRVIFVPRSVGEKHDVLPTTLDPPRHQYYRRLLNNGLSPRSVRGMQDMIREMAGELIDGFFEAGECEFIKSYAEKLPIYLFLHLLDLPREDAEQLRYWSDKIVHADGSMSYEEAQALIFNYLQPYIDARLGGGGADMLTGMINGTVEEGRALTRPEMFSLVMQVLMAGLDTVVNMLGFVMLFLARNPTHRKQLTEDPSLIPAAMEEIFRRYSVVSVAREVRKDMRFAGVDLKQGDLVLACTPLVGMDDDLNESPSKVDFHRRSIQHVVFGKGNHICPGAQLARTEIRITIEEWLKRIPDFEVDPGETIRFRGGIVTTVDRLPLQWARPDNQS